MTNACIYQYIGLQGPLPNTHTGHVETRHSLREGKHNLCRTPLHNVVLCFTENNPSLQLLHTTYMSKQDANPRSDLKEHAIVSLFLAMLLHHTCAASLSPEGSH